jgi:hypothetical protein
MVRPAGSGWTNDRVRIRVSAKGTVAKGSTAAARQAVGRIIRPSFTVPCIPEGGHVWPFGGIPQ